MTTHREAHRLHLPRPVSVLVLATLVGACASKPVDEACYDRLEKETAFYEDDGNIRRMYRTVDFADRLAAARFAASNGNYAACLAYLDSAKVEQPRGNTIVEREKQHIDARNGMGRPR